MTAAPAEFQFHKGTIRTLAQEIIVVGIIDFNSIKVRLELAVSNKSDVGTHISIP